MSHATLDLIFWIVVLLGLFFALRWQKARRDAKKKDNDKA